MDGVEEDIGDGEEAGACFVGITRSGPKKILQSTLVIFRTYQNLSELIRTGTLSQRGAVGDLTDGV